MYFAEHFLTISRFISTETLHAEDCLLGMFLPEGDTHLTVQNSYPGPVDSLTINDDRVIRNIKQESNTLCTNL